MKSGIMISVGSYNKDLTEATDDELKEWIKLMTDAEKSAAIRVLVNTLRRLPDE